jgi:hypothetical protein
VSRALPGGLIYSATKDELFDIFRILQGLKQIIFAQINQEVQVEK